MPITRQQLSKPGIEHAYYEEAVTAAHTQFGENIFVSTSIPFSHRLCYSQRDRSSYHTLSKEELMPELCTRHLPARKAFVCIIISETNELEDRL